MMQNPTFDLNQSQQTIHLFWRMEINGWWHRLWAWVTHRTSHLLELDETLCCARVENSHYAGLHSVNINRIRGTEGKSDAFDAAFYPTKETTRSRWLSVAREKLLGHDLPPVELLDVDGIYYVRDGHHRISVARSLGQSYVDAEIIVMNLNHRIM